MFDHTKWHPLERNPVTNELFLRLRKHEDIIMTPPRPEDVDNFLETMNDPRVYHWSVSTLHPYLREHAEATWAESKKRADGALADLEEASLVDPPRLVNSCPVQILRKVREDGTDEFVGNFKIRRCPHGEILNTDTVDWEHKAENEAENARKELGDPTIIWSISYFVVPKFHGQGIMTDAVDTIMHDWALPHMGARHFIVGAFDENVASRRVFEKNGFHTVRIIEKFKEVRGEWRKMRVMERTFEA